MEDTIQASNSLYSIRHSRWDPRLMPPLLWETIAKKEYTASESMNTNKDKVER